MQIANGKMISSLAAFSKPLLRGTQTRSFSVTSRTRANWGFIGLGQMGYQMAKNLQAKLPATDTLYVHDIDKSASKRFIEEVAGGKGAAVKVAECVREATEPSEVTVTVLPQPAHVKGVFHRILNPTLPELGSGKERLFIDCSTIDPSSSKEVARAVHTTQQGRFVDAPMSGGVVGARAGTLTFMTGAPSSVMPRLESILSMMGKKVLHCGEEGGAGLSAKLANNYILAVANIATAEAMNLGIKWGLDPKVLASVINVSTGRCWPSEFNNPVKGVVQDAPASRDYAGGFGISLMKKDLDLAILAAEEAGAKLELGYRVSEVYDAAVQDENCAGKDFSVVYRHIGGTE